MFAKVSLKKSSNNICSPFLFPRIILPVAFNLCSDRVISLFSWKQKMLMSKMKIVQSWYFWHLERYPMYQHEHISFELHEGDFTYCCVH